MKDIKKISQKSKNIKEFSLNYFNRLKKIFENINEKELTKFEKNLLDARSKGKTIFVFGNGGSASTATTMANDLGFDIIKKTKTSKAFKLLSINDNTSVLTAIANDVGYENIFINQLKIHYRSGDSIILISASGNSPNILKAAEWVKNKGGAIIGFLGFTGGKLIDLCDVKIHVQSEPGEYGPVEDAHLIMNHILAHWFQNKLK